MLSTFVVKFSTVFVVFVVVAGSALAAPAASDNAAINRILGSRSLSETKNYHLLTPELADISLYLHQALNKGAFKFGNSEHLHNFMVDVDLKIKEIAEDVASIASRVESVADTVDAFHFASPWVDYNVKRIYIKTLCEDTLATTNDVLGLIDETKGILGKGVSPYTMRIVHWHLTSITDILRLAAFGAVRKIMQQELDTERTDIAIIEGKIEAAKQTVDVISIMVDSKRVGNRNMSEQDLVNAAEALVKVVDQLKAEVLIITRKIYFLVLLRVIEEYERQH